MEFPHTLGRVPPVSTDRFGEELPFKSRARWDVNDGHWGLAIRVKVVDVKRVRMDDPRMDIVRLISPDSTTGAWMSSP